MSEIVTATATWSDPLRPTGDDPVSHTTWEAIKQADANRDAWLRSQTDWLRSQIEERIPGGPGAYVWRMPPVVVASQYQTNQAASSANPEHPFGWLIANSGSIYGFVTFRGCLPSGGYLQAVRVWVRGNGAEPADSDKPVAYVVHGAFGMEDPELEDAAASGIIVNHAGTWGNVYPLTYPLPTPRPATHRRIIEVRVESGIVSDSVLVIGVDATIVSTAS